MVNEALDETEDIAEGESSLDKVKARAYGFIHVSHTTGSCGIG